MQLDFFVIIAAFLIVIVMLLAFIAGVLFSQRNEVKDKYIYLNDGKITKPDKQPDIVEKSDLPSLSISLAPDDVINHEGVGIVHRPSKEELDKINEPEQTRLAKEAIAETLRQEVPPEI